MVGPPRLDRNRVYRYAAELRKRAQEQLVTARDFDAFRLVLHDSI
jgi:hypothetical protein